MSKSYVYLALLMLLVFAYDATSRLAMNTSASDKPFQTNFDDAYILPVLSENSKAQIEASIKRISGSQNEEADSQDDDSKVINQANQSGELQTVFARDKQLQLKAVIQSNDISYALIEVTPLKAGQSKLVRFDNQADVEGFKLSILSNTRVALHAENQDITLIMYQGAKQ